MPLARRQALPLGVEHQIMKGIPGIAINANTKYTPIVIIFFVPLILQYRTLIQQS